MEKNLKDYLHLYLGCVGYGSSGCSLCLNAEALHKVLLGEVEFKPILRKLSDMTEEERKEQEPFMFDSFKLTHYLLSKSFDLFDLIDAGLAIDKKKLKTDVQ